MKLVEVVMDRDRMEKVYLGVVRYIQFDKVGNLEKNDLVLVKKAKAKEETNDGSDICFNVPREFLCQITDIGYDAIASIKVVELWDKDLRTRIRN